MPSEIFIPKTSYFLHRLFKSPLNCLFSVVAFLLKEGCSTDALLKDIEGHDLYGLLSGVDAVDWSSITSPSAWTKKNDLVDNGMGSCIYTS